MTSLQIENVSRRFGENYILRDFSLTIQPGEFISLLGPSGCGKSTILRLLAGLDTSQAGKIQFGELARKSLVFQDANLLPWRSVLKNVALPFELQHNEAQADVKSREAIDLVGLTPDLEKLPGQLSGGMRMRASVARALATSPQLLLLDEPFAALDENTRYKLQEDLRRIWVRQKMTVVFVTHSIAEAVFLSERAIVLGGRPAQILLDHQLQLPRERSADLRTEPGFISEVKVLSNAFARTAQ